MRFGDFMVFFSLIFFGYVVGTVSTICVVDGGAVGWLERGLTDWRYAVGVPR